MKIHEPTTLFKNHGKSTGAWEIGIQEHSNGRVFLVIRHRKTLDGADVENSVEVLGKNIGRANETTCLQQAQLELESRVKKQLDKGYVRTVEEADAPATNSLGLRKPMLAHPIDKVKPEKIDWENAFGQPKLDGHRGLTDSIMYSRNGKEIRLPHIRDFLGDHQLLGAGLDGELYVHGMLLQDIGSLVKKPREESKQVKYYVYDVMLDMPYSERREWLQEALGRFSQSADSPVILLPSVPVTSREELTELHTGWLGEGYEGSILRHGLTGYEDGKRSVSLLKVKGFEDSEFKVVGCQRGTPKFGYEVPVWTCQVGPNKFFKVTAAGTMQEKDQQWRDFESYIGKLLTVQFFGFSKDGIPLLPVALRWREDV